MKDKNLFKIVKEHYQRKYDNKYNPRAVKAALYYAKKYGFDSGDNSTYNNEADAFKHTFASALVSMEENYIISAGGGYYHEWSNKNNSKAEYIMDTHNNGIGRQIAREIKREYGDKWNTFSPQVKDEIIAEKVYGRMIKEEIILDPSGRTKLKNYPMYIQSKPKQHWDRHGNITGYASEMENTDTTEDKIFSPENRVFYSGEINPAKIGKNDDLYEYVPKYLEQYWEKDFNLPREEELKQKVKTGELIYVHDYVRSDGTKVSGYYRHQG